MQQRVRELSNQAHEAERLAKDAVKHESELKGLRNEVQELRRENGKLRNRVDYSNCTVSDAPYKYVSECVLCIIVGGFVSDVTSCIHLFHRGEVLPVIERFWSI